MQAVYDGLANAQPQTGALRKAVFFVKAFEDMFLQCYDLLDHCFQAVIRQDDTYPSNDWRSLVQLCDHKYLMRRRYQKVKFFYCKMK